MTSDPPPAPKADAAASDAASDATPAPASKSSKKKKPAKKKKLSKKKKPAKKKKLSKKELARLAREKAEQERFEQERKAAELREQKEREYVAKKQEEQKQRLAEEDADLERLRKQRGEIGRKIREDAARDDDWAIFTACSHSVDVRSEADVNTFLENWQSQEDADLAGLFQQIETANTVVAQLSHMKEVAEVSQETRTFQRCDLQITRIRNVIYGKLEAMTMHILVFSDKFVGAKNEVLLSASSGFG
jgi:hypothetical protein